MQEINFYSHDREENADLNSQINRSKRPESRPQKLLFNDVEPGDVEEVRDDENGEEGGREEGWVVIQEAARQGVAATSECKSVDGNCGHEGVDESPDAEHPSCRHDGKVKTTCS